MQRCWVFGGLKHCGKSTHGRRWAERIGAAFVDADDALAAEYAARTGETLPVREIFRRLGEIGFRKLEAAVIGKLAAAEPAGGRVVALGGGVPANPWIDPADLKKLGVFVYLQIAPEAAYRRVCAGGLPPFLEKETDPRSRFLAICREREVFYRRYADRIVAMPDDEPVEAAAARLAALLEEER